MPADGWTHVEASNLCGDKGWDLPEINSEGEFHSVLDWSEGREFWLASYYNQMSGQWISTRTGLINSFINNYEFKLVPTFHHWPCLKMHGKGPDYIVDQDCSEKLQWVACATYDIEIWRQDDGSLVPSHRSLIMRDNERLNWTRRGVIV